jgi:uncharacterized protein
MLEIDLTLQFIHDVDKLQGMLIPRRIASDIKSALDRQAAVALIGPRQVGKTTTALEIGQSRNALYLDLEDRDDRARLASPALFFESFEDRLIILDEIHRMPEIFETLRGVIDRGRRTGKGKGRFLILGSASIDLLKQSGESLAGRIAYIDMTPITIVEIDNDRASRDRLWLRGGFPDSFLAESDLASLLFRRDFIRTYLERDIPLFGPRIPAETMERLWTMLAHRQGGILNASDLARSLSMSAQSVNRYIDLLVDLLLVRRLPPQFANVSKRLVKSPKVYIRDSGIVHALLGIETLEQLLGNPVAGMSWEGFVLEILLSVLPWPARASFYRTATGAEIDLIIEQPDGTIWAIEIKRSLSANVERGFHIARDDLKPARSFVIHAADDRSPIGENIEAISIRGMAEELMAVSRKP